MDTIICHSSHLVTLNKANLNCDIIANDFMTDKIWSGRWLRAKNMPDDKFTTWVTDEDLKNPPEWMIYCRMVEKEMVLGAYIIKHQHEVFIKKIDSLMAKQYNEEHKKSWLITDSSFLKPNHGLPNFILACSCY